MLQLQNVWMLSFMLERKSFKTSILFAMWLRVITNDGDCNIVHNLRVKNNRDNIIIKLITKLLVIADFKIICFFVFFCFFKEVQYIDSFYSLLKP